MSSSNTQTLNVVVIGSAGDIGRYIARRFLQRGHNVYGFDITTDPALLSLFDEMTTAEERSRFHRIHCNVMDSASVKKAFGSLSHVDVLSINTGGISDVGFSSHSEKAWLHDIDWNLNGYWRCMNAVLPGMAARGKGVIVNTSSVNGIGVFAFPAYSASKAAIDHMTKFAAVEFGKKGVRVVGVAPGTVKTRAWGERAKQNPTVFTDMLKWYPARCVSEPDDIAKMIEFCALDAPPTFTGHTITVDGGLTVGHDTVVSIFAGQDLLSEAGIQMKLKGKL